MEFLNDIANSKQAWVYILFSTIGLYSNIYWTIKSEKRYPNWKDLLELAGQLPFVWSVAIVVDQSPLLSLTIGIIPDRAFDFIKTKGFNLSFGNTKSLISNDKKETNSGV